MRIPVTGGAGFVGGNLVNQLASMGAGDIRVLDNLHRGFSRDSLPATVEFRRDEHPRSGRSGRCSPSSEIAFHLAAQSNVMGAVADAGYSFSANVVGTYNVLQSAAAAGVKRVVFTPSREV